MIIKNKKEAIKIEKIKKHSLKTNFIIIMFYGSQPNPNRTPPTKECNLTTTVKLIFILKA